MARAQTNYPIVGAWGFTLGQTLDDSHPGITLLTNHIYSFCPSNGFRNFDTYGICTTKGKVIVAIEGSRTFNEFNVFCMERKTISQLYTAKYGPPTETNIVENSVEYRQGSRRISITSTLSQPYKISVSYGDELLAQQALKEVEDEKAKAEREQLEKAKKETGNDF